MYTPLMPQEIKATVRQLLRGFKEYKNLLVNGKVDTIIVPIASSQELVIQLKKQKNTAENIGKMFQQRKKVITIKRDPTLFNELLRYTI